MFGTVEAGARSMDEAAAKMIVLPYTRDSLFSLLRKNGVGCEIGVAGGCFSRTILRQARPARLHLIDPWNEEGDSRCPPDIRQQDSRTGEERYAHVSRCLREEIESGIVRLHRNRSLDSCAQFADRYFDWIYLDADHTYEAVLADLRAYAPKMKPDGLIIGHGYADHGEARRMKFGVIEAVSRFCAMSSYRLCCVTLDGCPSYVLANGASAPAVRPW